MLPKFSIKTTFSLHIFAVGLLFLIASTPALPDQNDPRLDALFEQLHAVDDQQSGDRITDEIWEIWRDSGNDEINRLMREGVISMQTGRLHRAVRIFDRIIELAPEFAEGWNKRATVYYFLQEFEKSADDVRQTLQLEPRHFGATAGLGLIFLEVEYYENAIEAFERALDINPHLTGPKFQIERIQNLLLMDPA